MLFIFALNKSCDVALIPITRQSLHNNLVIMKKNRPIEAKVHNFDGDIICLTFPFNVVSNKNATASYSLACWNWPSHMFC